MQPPPLPALLSSSTVSSSTTASTKKPKIKIKSRPHPNPDIRAAMAMTALGATWDDRQAQIVDEKSDVDDLSTTSNSTIESSSSFSSSSSSFLRDILCEAMLASGTSLTEAEIPDGSTLTSYLATYMVVHHPLYPFLHLPTFCPQSTPRPLLLSLLSLGALAHGNRDLASRLHVESKVLANARIDTTGFTCRTAPLWVIQTMLLNTSFAAWAGDPRGLEFACSVKSFLANLAAGMAYELTLRHHNHNHNNNNTEHAIIDSTDPTWLVHESARRTYFSVYIFFAQLTACFNFSPEIANTGQANLMVLPCDESAWSATTTVRSIQQQPTLKAGLDAVFSGADIYCSAFGKRVLASAMLMECWAGQVNRFRAQPEQLDAALLSCWRSVHVLSAAPVAAGEDYSWEHHGGKATWMLARARVYGLDVITIGVEDALRYHDAGEVLACVRAVAPAVSRSGATIVAAETAFEVVFGNRHDGQIASATGGVEDVIAGWECAMYLIMWLRRVEHDLALVAGEARIYVRAADERELGLLQRIKIMQELDDNDYDDHDNHNGIYHRTTGALSVFVGIWWSRHGAKNVKAGWGIRSVLRDIVGTYANEINQELVG
ncbi:fungal-specific transcription factor domain-containing protein [Lipomyces japonicus]|uniref:fungal-specific transcription factor domain-containing protein n=1 Tax=Lipomyces japonicus TaxID=56871 RepID=UPI0034CEE004